METLLFTSERRGFANFWRQSFRQYFPRSSTDSSTALHRSYSRPFRFALRPLGSIAEPPTGYSICGYSARAGCFFTNQVRGYAGQWCKRVSQQVYRSARAVVCISERVCEEVRRNTDEPVSTPVVYNGVDPDIFYPEPDSLPSSVILSVGNLIPSKGHELLLRAFGAIEQRHPTLRCEIIGDGPERARLTALGAQLGPAQKISFLGRKTRTQVADAMRRCMVFALPSHYEGLGCVYLEAMSAGKPVIACRGQGIEEIIQHGANGFLIDPGDVHRLGTTLSTLLADPQLREYTGRHARRTILQSLTLAHQANRLEQIYRGSLA